MKLNHCVQIVKKKLLTSHLMVLKNVRIGNKTWSFGPRQTDSASSAQQTSDGGYIIAGALLWRLDWLVYQG